MLRISSYTIVSDRLASGDYALLNTLTGAIDLVDAEVGEGFRKALRSRPEGALVFDPDDSVTLVKGLCEETKMDLMLRGHLTEVSLSDERNIVKHIAEAAHEVITQQPVFMIVPNLDCNYRCTYCFERPLQNGLRKLGSEISHSNGNVVMTSRHIAATFRAIAWLQKRLGGAGQELIVLYGGEPLDQVNERVVRDIVAMGKAQGFRFAAITNGHCLDTYVDILGSQGIEQIQISIDGPKATHDRRRIHLGTTSSFDTIVANISRVLSETDAEVQIRVHVDPQNIELFGETLKGFEDRGWLANERVCVYANTVYAKDKQGLVEARIDHGHIHRQLKALAGDNPRVFTSAPGVHANRALKHVHETGGRFQIKATYCAANSGNYIFAPDGHIYACWESVGKECSRVGDYLELVPRLDAIATKKWFTRHVARIPECLSCSHALVCGGGCSQYAEYNTGSSLNPYCDDFQAVFAATLAEFADSTWTTEDPRQ